MKLWHLVVFLLVLVLPAFGIVLFQPWQIEMDDSGYVSLHGSNLLEVVQSIDSNLDYATLYAAISSAVQSVTSSVANAGYISTNQTNVVMAPNATFSVHRVEADEADVTSVNASNVVAGAGFTLPDGTVLTNRNQMMGDRMWFAAGSTTNIGKTNRLAAGEVFIFTNFTSSPTGPGASFFNSTSGVIRITDTNYAGMWFITFSSLCGSTNTIGHRAPHVRLWKNDSTDDYNLGGERVVTASTGVIVSVNARWLVALGTNDYAYFAASDGLSAGDIFSSMSFNAIFIRREY